MFVRPGYESYVGFTLSFVSISTCLVWDELAQIQRLFYSTWISGMCFLTGC